jgi:hypothetical protein
MFHSIAYHWLGGQSTTPRRKSRQRALLGQRRRPLLEMLEDRTVPSTYTVNLAGDAGTGTDLTGDIRYCINQATLANDNSTITFDTLATGPTITLTHGELEIKASMTIQGPGASLLTVSGNNASRVFDIQGSTTVVAISGLTISGGSAADHNGGGGILNNSGTLTVDASTLSGNTHTESGGAISNLFGTLTVTNSTLSDNTATGSASPGTGGGIYNDGTLTVTNSTLSGNSATGGNGLGGGIFSASSSPGHIVLTNDTLANNRASTRGGGLFVYDTTARSHTLHNTLIAGNFQGAGSDPSDIYDAHGAIDPASANNLIGDGSGGLYPSLGNLGGSSGNPLDPLLAPLGDYGGPTPTMALRFGSPAIDAASAAYAPVTDQRGLPRVGAPDIGAFEWDIQPQTISFAALPDRTYGDAPFTVSASASSGLPVSFSIVSGPATIAGETVTITGVGTVVIEATQAGDANYSPATPIEQSFNVAKAEQTITFGALADRTYGDAPFTVSASASSGLPVGFSIVSGPATIAGDTVTITGVGTVVIEATQAGDANYNPATPIEQSFVVHKAGPTAPDTVGVFDPATGTWYLRYDNSPGAPDLKPFAYGGPGYVAVHGDWDGKGIFTIGVVDGTGASDPNFAVWYLKNSNSPGAPDIKPFAYGMKSWIPVVGDWTGSGHTGIGVFDPTTATFYLRNSDSPGAPDFVIHYGGAGWVPVVGDWDGNGTTTIGVVDPSTETWYLRNSNSPGAPDIKPFAYGAPGWTPVAGNWNVGGSTGIGVFDPSDAKWYLRNSASPGAPDVTPFAYGGANWQPVPGNYPPVGVLSAATGQTPPSAPVTPLTDAQLQSEVAGALSRMADAGVDAAVIQALQAAKFQVSPLPNGMLTVAQVSNGTVLVNPNAAGYGWFIDPTPLQDEEFSRDTNGTQVAVTDGPAAGRMDLLTAVLHDMGTLAGISDVNPQLFPDDVMANLLLTGLRRTDALDAVFANPTA